MQIGFLVLVGLACKNAILIVEFAHDQCSRARSCTRRPSRPARVRFRPIMMTSFAFIVGVCPAGAGHGRRGRDAPIAGHGRLQPA